MSDQSGLTHFQELFRASLKEYETQTDITLAKHPLTEQFQHCDSVESAAVIFQERVPAYSDFRGGDRIMKPLNSAVSVLCALSVSVNLGLVRQTRKMSMGCTISLMHILQLSPFAKAIYVALAILIGVCPFFSSYVRICDIQVFQAVEDVDAHDPLVDLLESIQSFLKYLDVYIEIRPTTDMTEIVVKTLGELLFILALATKLIKQGQPGESLADILPDSM